MQRLGSEPIDGGFVTTGDKCLDEMLGGGFPLGGITELVGEGGAGKTQLALQASLAVQLPHVRGGQLGSACFLTTSGGLPTPRLTELLEEHPLIKTQSCGLNTIHTRTVSSFAELLRTLNEAIPKLVQDLASSASSFPLKLLVIDSLAAIFRNVTKTTAEILMERSRQLVEIAAALHYLASAHGLAIIVINEVTAWLNRSNNSGCILDSESGRTISYSGQARWFSRGNSLSQEEHLEARLGLVWANQVCLRIMMTRTRRRRFMTDTRKSTRRTVPPSTAEQPEDNEAVLIRRLSVVYSSCSPPSFADYIITHRGVATIGGKMTFATDSSTRA